MISDSERLSKILQNLDDRLAECDGCETFGMLDFFRQHEGENFCPACWKEKGYDKLLHCRQCSWTIEPNTADECYVHGEDGVFCADCAIKWRKHAAVRMGPPKSVEQQAREHAEHARVQAVQEAMYACDIPKLAGLMFPNSAAGKAAQEAMYACDIPKLAGPMFPNSAAGKAAQVVQEALEKK